MEIFYKSSMLYSIFIWIVTWILSSENVKLINFLQRDAKAEILCPERRHFHVTAFPFFSSFLSLSYYLARILLIYGSSFVDCGTWIQLTDCFFAFISATRTTSRRSSRSDSFRKKRRFNLPPVGPDWPILAWSFSY